MEIRAYHLDQAVEPHGARGRRRRSSPRRPRPRSSRRPSGRSRVRRSRTHGSSGSARSSCVRRSVLATSRHAPRGDFRTGVPFRSRWPRFDQAGEEGDRVYEALALTASARRRSSAMAMRLARGRSSTKPSRSCPRLRRSRALRRADHSRHRRGVARLRRRLRAVHGAGIREGASTRSARTCRRSPRRPWLLPTMRLELDEAEILLTRALELAGESGSVRARISATLAYAGFLKVKGGELDAGDDDRGGPGDCDRARPGAGAGSLAVEARLVARAKADLKLSEKLFREALRITAARGDRGSSRTTRLRWPRLWPSWGRSTKESGLRWHALTRCPRTRAATSSASRHSRSSAALRDATVRRRNCSCRR